jgi:hypothetical protein
VTIVTRFDYPLDAAALEAFLIHTRALADFLWGHRHKRDDGLAADYFGTGTSAWKDQGRFPDWYEKVRAIIGYGMAHVSYKRVDLDHEWAWQHRRIAHAVAMRLMEFAEAAPAHRLDPHWKERIRRAAIPVLTYLPRDTGPVGTPMIAFYRNPPRPEPGGV